jgi:prolyl-tRNA synthetase
MAHSDDDGLKLPPRIAPYHAVILPILNKPERAQEVLAYAESIKNELGKHSFGGRNIECHIDRRDLRGGEKSWEWIKKGVPLRIEVGPRDLDNSSCMVARRDMAHSEKVQVSRESLPTTVVELLGTMQERYLTDALKHQQTHTRTDITTFDELKSFFTPKNVDKPEIHGGFVLAKWCGDKATEEMLSELKITIRCLPIKQSGTKGTCILTGRPATLDAIFAKAY